MILKSYKKRYIDLKKISVEESRHIRLYIIWFHVCEISRKEIERQKTNSWLEEKQGKGCTLAEGTFGVMEVF